MILTSHDDEISVFVFVFLDRNRVPMCILVVFCFLFLFTENKILILLFFVCCVTVEDVRGRKLLSLSFHSLQNPLSQKATDSMSSKLLSFISQLGRGK